MQISSIEQHPQYTGVHEGVPQDPTVVEQLSGLWNRVFNPKAAPITGTITLAAWKDTGLIGEDRKYAFKQIIRDEAGRLFTPTREDFYVPVSINRINEYRRMPFALRVVEKILRAVFFFISRKEVPLPQHLPSSLFFGAKNNSLICFQYQQTPVKLRAQPITLADDGQAPVPFETQFAQVHRTAQGRVQGGFTYLFPADADQNSPVEKTWLPTDVRTEQSTRYYTFFAPGARLEDFSLMPSHDHTASFAWLQNNESERPVRHVFKVFVGQVPQNNAITILDHEGHVQLQVNLA